MVLLPLAQLLIGLLVLHMNGISLERQLAVALFRLRLRLDMDSAFPPPPKLSSFAAALETVPGIEAMGICSAAVLLLRAIGAVATTLSVLAMHRWLPFVIRVDRAVLWAWASPDRLTSTPMWKSASALDPVIMALLLPLLSIEHAMFGIGAWVEHASPHATLRLAPPMSCTARPLAQLLPLIGTMLNRVATVLPLLLVSRMPPPIVVSVLT